MNQIKPELPFILDSPQYPSLERIIADQADILKPALIGSNMFEILHNNWHDLTSKDVVIRDVDCKDTANNVNDSAYLIKDGVSTADVIAILT